MAGAGSTNWSPVTFQIRNRSPPRALQRASGQSHIIADLPGAISRKGRRRRTASAWHQPGAVAPTPAGMGSSVRDARARSDLKTPRDPAVDQTADLLAPEYSAHSRGVWPASDNLQELWPRSQVKRLLRSVSELVSATRSGTGFSDIETGASSVRIRRPETRAETRRGTKKPAIRGQNLRTQHPDQSLRTGWWAM